MPFMDAAHASAAEGAQPPEQDLGPLAWVHEELRKSLDGALKSLRRFVREAGGADIGDAVALGIRTADAGREGEIQAEAVGRRQAGPLADRHHHGAGLQSGADPVAEGDPGLACHHHRGDAPAGPREMRLERRQEGGRPFVDGPRRQTVGDHQGEVHGLAGRGGERGPRLLGEGAAEIGPAQIGGPVRGGGRNAQGLEAQGRDAGGDGRLVQGGVHGVAGLRMGETEAQHLAGGEPGPGPAEPDPRRGEAGEPRPGILAHAARPASDRPGMAATRRWFGPPGSRAPSASARPIRSSHASNSGARFRPSTSRR